jgi:hypothetical protein
MQPTISRETVLIDGDRRQPRLRWSAVFAGTVCGVGFWMLLQLLGLGIGLAAVDAGDAESLRGVGVGTTVWSLVSPLIAMFFGGVLAGKLAQTYDRNVAAVHGLVMWAITSIVGLCATIWIVAMIAAGAARTSGVALDATGHVMSWIGNTAERAPTLRDLGDLGIDTDDLLAPINQRLSTQGKPTITAAQLEAAMRGVVRRGIARGDFDRDLLIDQLVAHTQLSRADAIDIERQVEARLQTRAGQIAQRAGQYGLEAIDAAGKALTTVGISLLLSLITSVVGAIIGLRRTRRPNDKGGPHRRERDTEPEDVVMPPTEPVVTMPSTYPAP